MDRQALARKLFAAEGQYQAALARYHCTGSPDDRRDWVVAKARIDALTVLYDSTAQSGGACDSALGSCPDALDETGAPERRE